MISDFALLLACSPSAPHTHCDLQLLLLVQMLMSFVAVGGAIGAGQPFLLKLGLHSKKNTLQI